MSDQVEQATPAAEAATTSLQLSDILLCAQVIQLASQRGAFKAEEFSQVGALYDRIVSFLKESGALQQSAPATDEQATEQPVA